MCKGSCGVSAAVGQTIVRLNVDLRQKKRGVACGGHNSYERDLVTIYSFVTC